jgi:hypothetical protein
MKSKFKYRIEVLSIQTELPRGLWEDVKEKVKKEVNFDPNKTQILISVFLNFLGKTIKDYETQEKK